MLPSSPYFSVIIPLSFHKDEEETLTSTLQSLKDQSFRDWECHLIASTDTSPASTHFEDPRIHYHPFTTPQEGSTETPQNPRNRGITLSQGKWLLFLEAGETIPQNYLTSKKAAITDQPGRDLYVCPWIETNEFGKTIVRDPLGAHHSHEEMLASCLVYPPFATPAAVIRRSSLKSPSLWPSPWNGALAEEAVFWFKVLPQVSIGFHESCGLHHQRIQDTFQKPLTLLYETFEKSIKLNLLTLQEQKIKPSSRYAEELYQFYFSMKKRALFENNESITQNAQINLQKIYPQLSPWKRFLLKIHSFFGQK